MGAVKTDAETLRQTLEIVLTGIGGPDVTKDGSNDGATSLGWRASKASRSSMSPPWCWLRPLCARLWATTKDKRRGVIADTGANKRIATLCTSKAAEHTLTDDVGVLPRQVLGMGLGWCHGRGIPGQRRSPQPGGPTRCRETMHTMGPKAEGGVERLI